MLTIESMLMVVDRKTGNKTDVRALLGITPEDVKCEKLRDELSNYELPDSRWSTIINPSTIITEKKAFKVLDVPILEYDTGTFDDESGGPKE